MQVKDPYRVKKKDMVHHKYLEDLGLQRRECGVNFAPQKKWMRKEQQRWYGFDQRETYNLDVTFAQWLYEHLRMYLDVAGRVIDLEWKHVPLEGELFGTREAVQHVLWPLEGYLVYRDLFHPDASFDFAEDLLTLAGRRWAEIAPYIWW